MEETVEKVVEDKSNTEEKDTDTDNNNDNDNTDEIAQEKATSPVKLDNSVIEENKDNNDDNNDGNGGNSNGNSDVNNDVNDNSDKKDNGDTNNSAEVTTTDTEVIETKDEANNDNENTNNSLKISVTDEEGSQNLLFPQKIDSSPVEGIKDEVEEEGEIKEEEEKNIEEEKDNDDSNMIEASDKAGDKAGNKNGDKDNDNENDKANDMDIDNDEDEDKDRDKDNDMSMSMDVEMEMDIDNDMSMDIDNDNDNANVNVKLESAESNNKSIYNINEESLTNDREINSPEPPKSEAAEDQNLDQSTEMEVDEEVKESSPKPTTVPTTEPSVSSPPQDSSDSKFPQSKHPYLKYPEDIYKVKELPKSEQLKTLTQQEKNQNPDYFKASKTRTPEKYLLVRECIIKAWLQNPTVYLTKMGVHKFYQGLGCVNSVGRVHTYLESMGLVNVGIDKPNPKRMSRSSNQNAEPRQPVKKRELPSRGEVGRSSRRRFDKSYNEDTSRDSSIDGKNTPKQTASSTVLDTSSYPQTPVPSIFPPYHLLPLNNFNEDFLQPFTLKLASTALGQMLLHSLLSQNEVIGLMGGKFDATRNILTITDYFPCITESCSQTQIEMDPEVSVLGKDEFTNNGIQVCGWYHSHPNFPANPSYKDCLTQAHHQLNYKVIHHSNTLEIFIGLILNPQEFQKPVDLFEEDYDPSAVETSESVCYSMMPFDSKIRDRKPYKLNFELLGSTSIDEGFNLSKIESLLDTYKEELKGLVEGEGLDKIRNKLKNYLNESSIKELIKLIKVKTNIGTSNGKIESNNISSGAGNINSILNN